MEALEALLLLLRSTDEAPEQEKLPSIVLLVPVVLGIVAVWLLTMEYQRRENLVVLEKNYAVCERWWTPPFSKSVEELWVIW